MRRHSASAATAVSGPWKSPTSRRSSASFAAIGPPPAFSAAISAGGGGGAGGEVWREPRPLEHAGHVVGGGEPDEAVRAQRAQPLPVEADLRLRRVEDLEGLLLVGLGIALDLLARQGRARLRAAGG